jgi:hypothetical protein
MSRWRELVRGRDWKEALWGGLPRKDLTEIRGCTHTGRPLGGDSWVAKLEVALGRRLRPLPGGRPRKHPAKKDRKHVDCPKFPVAEIFYVSQEAKIQALKNHPRLLEPTDLLEKEFGLATPEKKL